MDNMQLWLISSTDSINLNSGADGFYLNPDLDGLTGLPDIRSSNGVNAGYDGGWTSTQLWDARLITIRGLIVDKDGSQVEAKRKALTKLVGQGKTEPLTLKFVTEFGSTYTCTVRTTSCTMALQNIFSRQEYQIQLRADDPLIYDDGGDDIKATLRVQTDSEGFEIPFDIPLDISGGADPVVVDAGEDANYPVITMYGELHSPTVVNQTTNQQLQLGADLGGSSLEWTEYDTASGSAFQITGIEGAPLTLTEITGNATQDGTPTPDAPVAVNTTTGENVVKIMGKNLIPFTNQDFTLNNVRYYVQNGSLYLNGSSSGETYSTNIQFKNQFAFTLPAGTYIASHKTGLSGITAYIKNYSDNDNLAILAGNTQSSSSFTLAEQTQVYVGFYAYQATNSNVNSEIMLELGSTATAYEAYQGEEYELNLGKNLLDTSATIQGVWNNASNTTTCTFFTPIYTGETFTISNQDTATWRFSAGLTTNPTNNPAGTGSQISAWQTGASYTITAQSNGFLWVQLRKNANTAITPSDIPDDVFMVERGSSATSFAPYFTPIELAKIGNYQDYIWKDGNEWKIHKEVGKVVLDGSETWTLNESGTGYVRFTTVQDGIITSFSNSQIYTMSDKFVASTQTETVNANADANRVCVVSNGRLLFKTLDTTLNTVAKWQTWLASNPTTVYYALATPTTTEITDSTLLAQLNFIANLYGGTNNIMLVGTGAQGEIGVEYGTEYIEIPADVAVIDCKDRTVMLNGANAYNLLVPGSEFIQLQPGENKLYLTSESTGDGGYAEIKFKTGNLSI